MQRALLLCDTAASVIPAVRSAFVGVMSLTVTDNAEKCVDLIQNDASIAILLIDAPSRRAGAPQLIGEVGRRNDYIRSIPVLLLTDAQTRAEDLALLGGAAVDCAEKPIEPALLRNRVNNCIRMVNSVSFAEFAQMLKALPSNIYLKDEQARYVFISQVWRHLDTGDDPNWTIRGKTDLDIRFDKENARRALESDMALIRSGKGTSYVIEENEDSVQEFLQIIKEPLFADDGHVRGIIALINNVTEQERLRRELKRLSVTDPLTGVYNRAYFEEYTEKLSDFAPYPLTVLSADCDGMRKLNDACGHTAGDDYLRACVHLLRENLPESGVLFRTGGDEFIVFLPGVSAQEAADCVDRLSRAAAACDVQGHALSVSVGCCTSEDPGADVRRLIAMADNRMYEEKQRKKARW